MKKKILIIILTIVFAGSLIAAKFILPNSKIGGLIGGTSKKTGSNFIKPGANDTHKGIVYLDPTDLEKYCTEVDVNKNVNEFGTYTGVKKGCMKFYIYDDTGDTYKMILDHNTSGNIDYGYGSNKRSSVIRRLYVDTYEWMVDVDLMSADEVAHLVGADREDTIHWTVEGLDGRTDSATHFYFDGAGDTIETWNSSAINSETNKSKFSWLFDNTYHCLKHGCAIEDNNEYDTYGSINDNPSTSIYGYWLKEKRGLYAFNVDSMGKLDMEKVEEKIFYGVRPVVILPKSKLSTNNKTAINITYVAPTSNDTHKGIVYLNPTNSSKNCTAEDAANNTNSNGTFTGIKSGCMKFYIFDDSGETYKLLLDHNTGSAVPWSGGDDENSIDNDVTIYLLAETKGWIGHPRLLTANEVAHIVGADKALQWDQNKPKGKNVGTQISSYFLDGSGNNYDGWGEQQIANESSKSKYAWLFDNTYHCLKYGCNEEDNNIYDYDWDIPSLGLEGRSVNGYWLSKESKNNIPSKWFVYAIGGVSYESGISGDYHNGIRPVIELKKSEVVLK